ncbi:hypothetical protein ACLB2K_044239 [Fragaria x ananassa]
MEDGNANNNTAIISRETIDQVAGWVSATVSSAFFSSLERFSCVNVATEDDDDDEADHHPLALTNLAHPDQQQHHPNDVAQLPV